MAQPVSLTDAGSTVALANGIVSLQIDKANGQCTTLRRGSSPNLLANGGRIYFDANGGVNGGTSVYVPFDPDLYEVVTNTPGRVEVAFTDTNFTGFRTSLHYVLREADSGVYVFTHWHHGAGDPEAVLDQSRMVIRSDPNLFTRAYAFPGKTGQMIEPSLLVASKPTIMDATYKLPASSSYTNATGYTDDGFPVYTKYDWSDYMEDHRVHGVAGDTYGLWMVMGSVEYFNGGPTKANQTLHGTETTPVVLWLFQGQHKGAEGISMEAEEEWSKVNGPYFIYVNDGTNAADLWSDAQSQAVIEQDNWPYDWMDHADYPVERGAVRGRLHVVGESTANALVVLAQPGVHWHQQGGTNYQFWTRADVNGSFLIPKVRPGTYTLQADVPTVLGLMEQSGVVVVAGQTNDLGTLDWNPPRYEQRLFRLGTPDLSTAEFRFGSRMRQFGLWWRYLEEQGTNDLDFVIGSSVTSNDWYYALSLLAVELTPTNGIWVSPRWNIHFDIDEIPPAPARLSVALAGAVGNCAFYVYVNGVNVCPNPATGIYTLNDGGIYRSAVRLSRPQPFEVTFDPNLLVVGANTISFTVRATGGGGNPWSGVKPVYPRAGIMFDCVQLEAGNVLADVQPRVDEVDQTMEVMALMGSGGYPGATYLLQETHQLQVEAWSAVQTNQFNSRGDFSLSHPLQPSSSAAYYRLEMP